MARPTPLLTLNGTHYRLDNDGRYPLFVEGKLAAWAWRAGREFGIDHSDLTLAGKVGVPKSIDTYGASYVVLDGNGDIATDPEPLSVSSVDFTQQLVETLPGLAEFRLDRRDAAFRDFMLDGGPPLDEVPLDDLTRFNRWGPKPDPEDADKTGSGRLKVQRHPTAMSIFIRDLMLEEGPTDEQLEDSDRWNFEQGLRGYHVIAYIGDPSTIEERDDYTGADVVPFDAFVNYSAHATRNYLPTEAAPGTKPGIGVGQGYREAGGGLNDLFDRARPDGVLWERSGLSTGSALHMTIDALVFSALCMRSKSAADSAMAHFEAVASFMWAGEDVSSRGWGLMFKAGAYLGPLLKYRPKHERDSVFRSMDEAIRRLTLLNKKGMPAPDNGKTIEGGHLTGKEVYESFGALVAEMFPQMSDDDVKELCSAAAESDAGFYVALLATGLDDWIDLWDRLGLWEQHPAGVEAGAAMRASAMHQLKHAAVFMVDVLPKPHIDVHQGFVGGKRVPRGGLWSDVGAIYGLAEGGDNPNDIKGTKIRMDAGGIARIAKRFNNAELLIVAQTVLGYCNDAGWWNGSDRTKAMLEYLWPLGFFYGWDGTFAVAEPDAEGKLLAQKIRFRVGEAV